MLSTEDNRVAGVLSMSSSARKLKKMRSPMPIYFIVQVMTCVIMISEARRHYFDYFKSVSWLPFVIYSLKINQSIILLYFIFVVIFHSYFSG